jgi:hypothetical protein
VRLVMFHPPGVPMERGWAGRIDGDRVVHLAAQTLQSFFTGGGAAREHASYPLDASVLLAPVLNPPTVRIFDQEEQFAFANANAIAAPGATIDRPAGVATVDVLLRPTAVIGADEELAGYTLLAEARAPSLPPPKDRDFALLLGPSMLTADEWVPDGFDWDAAAAYARLNTGLRPGDLIAGPPTAAAYGLGPGGFSLHGPPVGALEGRIAS